MNLLSVIQEAISNALKYAECSKIEIEFYFSETQLNIRITDNGKGFILGQETTDSYGLRNMKKRMEECNAIYAITSDSSGTVIHIKK